MISSSPSSLHCILKYSLTVVLLVACSLYSLGLVYPSVIHPGELQGRAKLVHSDGWIEDSAKLYFPAALSAHNLVSLRLGAWRPAGVEPARLVVRSCGEEVARLAIDSEVAFPVELRGACSPPELEFDFENPFRASESDSRALGAQLISAELSSRLGVPIVAPFYVALSVLLVFLFVVVLERFTEQWLISTLLASSLSFGMLLSSSWAGLSLLVPLLLFSIAFVFGLSQSDPPESVWKTEPLASESRGRLGALLCVLAVLIAAVLRFYSLDFGLPENYHPDEVPKVNAMMRMYEQDTLNPQYFLHPSLLLYSTYGMNSLLHALFDLPDFRASGFLAGRLVSCLAGIASVYLVYLISKRLFDSATAGVAALLLAIFPLAVTGSRYLKEDSLLTFFILLCVYLVFLAAEKRFVFFVLLAGLVGGFTASVKYSGALSLFIVIAAPFLASKSFVPEKRYLLPTFFALLLIPVGFLIGTPYSVLDSEAFLRDFNHERGHMLRGHTILITAWSQYWMYHFARSIMPALTLPLALLAVAGLGYLTRKLKVEYWYVVALFLLFYLPAEFVKAKPAPQPERYIYPTLPFLAIASAAILAALARYCKPRYWVLLALLFVFPLRKSLLLTEGISDDTRQRMKRWVHKEIEPGSKFLIGWKTYNPRIDEERFEIEYLKRSNVLGQLYGAELSESGADYLMISSLWFSRYFEQPNSDPALREVLRRLIARYPIEHLEEPDLYRYGFHNPVVVLFRLQADASAGEQWRNRKLREIMRAWTVEGKTPISLEWSYLKELL